MNVLLCALALLAPAATAVAASFEIDPVHTSVVFKVNHLGVTNVYGRFREVAGTVVLDEADPAKSQVSITIPADSVDTNVEKRDTHLRGPDFLSAKEFPNIRFQSTKVEKTGDATWRITGDLALHGVTRPVTADFTYFGKAKDAQGKTKAGGEATFSVRRSEFGVTYGVPAIGDEIVFVLGIEGFEQP
jgi:polyisoprenoid-binding protein YceI